MVWWEWKIMLLFLYNLLFLPSSPSSSSYHDDCHLCRQCLSLVFLEPDPVDQNRRSQRPGSEYYPLNGDDDGDDDDDDGHEGGGDGDNQDPWIGGANCSRVKIHDDEEYDDNGHDDHAEDHDNLWFSRKPVVCTRPLPPPPRRVCSWHSQGRWAYHRQHRCGHRRHHPQHHHRLWWLNHLAPWLTADPPLLASEALQWIM